MTPNYNYKLNINRIISSMYNLIISQEVVDGGRSGGFADLLDESRVDGFNYGDTKTFISVDTLSTIPFEGDQTYNILETHRAKDPHIQAMVMNNFRQIPLTTGGDFFDKQAFLAEGSYMRYISAVLTMIRYTKRIYEGTLFNRVIGTHKSTSQVEIEVDASKYPSLVQGLAVTLADLFDELKQPNTEYNDIGFTRAYDISELETLVNNKLVNEMTMVNTPSLFHDETVKSMIDKGKINHRYLGTVKTTGGTGDGTVRACYEMTAIKSGSPDVHLWPGMVIPTGYAYKANEAYTPDENILAIVTCKGFAKWMSGFTREAEWINPRNGNHQHYLNFGTNDPDKIILDDAPWIIIKKKVSA